MKTTTKSIKSKPSEYKQRLAKILISNPNVALICGFHAASLILKHLPEFDFNPVWVLHGDSGTGKTLALNIAMSMFSSPDVYGLTKDSVFSQKELLLFGQEGAIFDDEGLFRTDTSKLMALSKLSDHKVSTDCRSHFSVLFASETALKIPPYRCAQMIQSSFNPLWHDAFDSLAQKELRAFIKNNHGCLYTKMKGLVDKNAISYKALHSYFFHDLCAHKAGNLTRNTQKEFSMWALASTGCVLISQALDNADGFTSEHVEDLHKQAVRLMVHSA